ncbi:ROK family transcriptional regulator [Segnochrobactrum spirostomi]|uniref:ROK family transcriptional regulator n=1 Tax=Segnochrobactrum spirostomi TaxID=2608987 RepID=A0A6A7Y6F7_9HYPH|nr:ROK family transcriptional regulator [Segnochrobactrum spirostomi]MQT13149.1 ROK family transcriptional regulator [Segnochrobactrum spirostomi]
MRAPSLGKNHEFTKRLNRQTVLDLIRRGQVSSRAELARITGLSPQSISNITDELERAGLIEPVGKTYGGKGQPPTNFRLVADAAFGVGIHLDRDYLCGTLVDFDFAPQVRIERRLTATSLEGMHAEVRALIDAVLDEGAPPRERVWGIGVASPLLRDRHVLDTPSIEGSFWATFGSYALDRRLSEETGLAVVVENDANAGALGEATFGNGRDLKSFCYLFLGYGLGCGLVENGTIFRGGWGNAGEVGRLLVPVAGGGEDHLESVLSIEGLRRRVGAGESFDDPVAFAALVARHPEAVDAWIADAARHLRWVVSVLENVLDPQAVLIGSLLPEALIARLVAAAEPLHHTIAVRDDRAAPRLKLGHLERDLIALGAATTPILATLEADPGQNWILSGEPQEAYKT